MIISRKRAEEKLRNVFGLEHFYDEQWDAISKILRGERVLMIERTGFGKSLCYQFPAILFDGITVIFSPLIVLIDDICDSGQTLKEIGQMLTKKGARYIVPVVIAKTVGGTE